MFFAVDEDLAVGGRVQTVDAADERRLARAAHADDAVESRPFRSSNSRRRGLRPRPPARDRPFSGPAIRSMVAPRTVHPFPVNTKAAPHDREAAEIHRFLSEYPAPQDHTRRQPARLDIRMANCFIAGPSFVRCRIRERCAYYSASSCKSQPFPAASRRKGVDLIKPSHLACKKGGSPPPYLPRAARAARARRSATSRCLPDRGRSCRARRRAGRGKSPAPGRPFPEAQ